MIKKMLKSVLQLPAEALLASSNTLQSRIDVRSHQAILSDPRLTAKFYPYRADRSSYCVPKVSGDGQGAGSELPIPPPELRVHRHLDASDQYLAAGKTWIDNMTRILDASGVSVAPRNRVLDFGCGDGMMLRQFRSVAENGEAWGTDLNGELMMWCQQHLSPPFKFATTTSFPHLPFEDGYFDLVYAFSVFTHICDLAETWLLELKRIVRPGGVLYLTVHDRHSIGLILKNYPEIDLAQHLNEAQDGVSFKDSDFALFTLNRVPGGGLEGDTAPAQVFYDIDYLAQHWGNYLQVVSINPEAYGYQTAMVLKKS